ncbi:MAG TPA: hypothetical protein VGG64_04345 [Pirellulales bacterium]|jgi:glyoxylase-like metal-dependent hydrolase (beta-lactamase superfamily II)
MTHCHCDHAGSLAALQAGANATTTTVACVNLVPLMIGARGRDDVRDFYATHFVSQLLPDVKVVNVSRAIDEGGVVDEVNQTQPMNDLMHLASNRTP